MQRIMKGEILDLRRKSWSTEETAPVVASLLLLKVSVRDGYINFTRHFKYLGSWISDTLQYEYELDVRLKRAKGQLGSLKTFFRCPGIELATNYKVHMTIPVNTA